MSWARSGRRRLGAVLFERDGIVTWKRRRRSVVVSPAPGAIPAIARLRALDVATGILQTRAGIGLRAGSPLHADEIEAAADQVLRPLGPIVRCDHVPADGCGCRRPQPGLIRRAAAELGVETERCAVVTTSGADVEAASALGIPAVLVPAPHTPVGELYRAPEVATALDDAVELLVGPGR